MVDGVPPWDKVQGSPRDACDGCTEAGSDTCARLLLFPQSTDKEAEPERRKGRGIFKTRLSLLHDFIMLLIRVPSGTVNGSSWLRKNHPLGIRDPLRPDSKHVSQMRRLARPPVPHLQAFGHAPSAPGTPFAPGRLSLPFPYPHSPPLCLPSRSCSNFMC